MLLIVKQLMFVHGHKCAYHPYVIVMHVNFILLFAHRFSLALMHKDLL